MSDVRNALRTRPYMFAVLLAALLLIANVIADPTFGKPANWPEQLATLAPFAILAMASTPAIVSGGGGLDISVGPIAVVTNVILVAWFLPHDALGSPWLAIPLLLLIGAAIGAINGILVAVLRFEPVIATLCAFFILTGISLKIAPSPLGVENAQWLKDLAIRLARFPGLCCLWRFPS